MNSVIKCALGAGVLLGAMSQAYAQSATNEAWIGQTGETNTITIDQAGIGNRAGANASTLRLNQDGRFNAITIKQTGWSNGAGAQVAARPDVPEGVNQEGDRNAIDIAQQSGVAGGTNVIAAILQTSLHGLSELANSLLVRQDDAGGDGAAGHSIGWVVQKNTADDLGENAARLFQSGGLAGLGNAIGSVLQRGYANSIETSQTLDGNRIGGLRQGGRNEMTVLQGEGESNTVDRVDQVGELNKAQITQSGDRNYVASALQNNEGVAIAGNTLVVMLAGNDNGGDGNGGGGAFISGVTSQVGVHQAAFTQIGDDNAIRLTVNGGSGNLFGVSQVGDGNGAVVSISPLPTSIPERAAGNEVAIYQQGDDNNVAADITGNANAAGVYIDGARNWLKLSQSGDGNAAGVDIEGGDNNNRAAPAMVFAAPLQALAGASALFPGYGLQAGHENRATIIVRGGANLFAFAQQGDKNALSLTVRGSANQAVSAQSGNLNAALITQSGTGNALAVHQF